MPYALFDERCWDCLTAQADVRLAPCDHICLCEACYLRRRTCATPFCYEWINWESTEAQLRSGSHRRSRSG